MTNKHVTWPKKVNLLGIEISPTDYDEAVEATTTAAKSRTPGIVSCHAVHAVVTASCDASLKDKVNTFDMITPDGQPVRWALNLLHRARLQDRVYGPELTLRLCKRAAAEGVSIYLYGGSTEVVEKLQSRLKQDHPDLQIAGYESPPFRELTPDEDAEMVERINASGAGMVFIGLGCPKQDLFAYEHRDKVHAVQVCVGAAFDFHAGVKPMAPEWMQRNGLEWLYRLLQEPHRLWRRYLVTNTIFVFKLGTQIACMLLRTPLKGDRKSHL